MLKKYIILFSSIILLCFSFLSCISDAVEGKVLAEKEFNGMSIDDLNSQSEHYKKVSLSFDENGQAHLKQKKYYYYDTVLTQKNYDELSPLFNDIINYFAYGEQIEVDEAKDNRENLFNELKKCDLFVLANHKIDTIETDFDNNVFNFSGYLGLGFFDGKDYMLYLVSTKDVEKGYVFEYPLFSYL